MPRKGVIERPAIKTYVDSDTKARFLQAARRQGCATEADFLRAIIHHVLKSEVNTTAAGGPATRDPGERFQLKVNLNREENERL